MVNKNTDFFHIVDKFSVNANIPSIEIIKAELDFTPKYTIGIPTFKRVKLLKETIESAINQEDFNDYDIIVVDNDPERYCDTEILIKKFNNKRISYYKNSKNIGMTGNWNRLFELAAGDFLIMLHDDDFLYPNYLSIIDKLQRKMNFSHDAIYPMYNYFDNNITTKPPIQKLVKYTNYINLTYKDFALSNIIGAPVGACFKKDKVLKIGGFDDSFYPSIDYAFYVKFSYLFKSIKLLNNELSVYRIHENESQNISTVLGFIEKDRTIRLSIVLSFFIKWVKNIFLNYYEFDSIVYLKKTKKLYRVEEQNLIDENFNFFKMINFILLNKIWALKFKLKKNTLEVI